MAATPESKAKAKIKKLLNKYGAYSHMPVQNGMGAPTLDFVCCYGGLYLAIEAKAPGKKPSARQLKTMSQISAAGGVALCVGTNDEQFEALEKLLKALHDKRISFSQAPEAAAGASTTSSEVGGCGGHPKVEIRCRRSWSCIGRTSPKCIRYPAP